MIAFGEKQKTLDKHLQKSGDEKFILEVARKNNEVSKNLIKKSQAEMAKEIKNLLEFTSKVSKKYGSCRESMGEKYPICKICSEKIRINQVLTT